MEVLLYIFYGYSFLVFGLIIYAYLKLSHEHFRVDQLYSIVNKLTTMVFLVNRKIEVQETNFYDKSGDTPSEKPVRFGNLIRCKHGTDAGLCGTSEHCKSCPIRALITKSFIDGSDFDDVSVPMELYDKNGNINKVDIKIGGQHVTVNGQDKIVIKADQTQHEI